MNRFGLRLAAGLAVMCLGGLAIYQARSEKPSELAENWPDLESSLAEGPQGMPADEFPMPPDYSSDPTVVRGNNGMDATSAPDAGVRLASHEQPFSLPALESSVEEDDVDVEATASDFRPSIPALEPAAPGTGAANFSAPQIPGLPPTYGADEPAIGSGVAPASTSSSQLRLRSSQQPTGAPLEEIDLQDDQASAPQIPQPNSSVRLPGYANEAAITDSPDESVVAPNPVDMLDAAASNWGSVQEELPSDDGSGHSDTTLNLPPLPTNTDTSSEAELAPAPGSTFASPPASPAVAPSNQEFSSSPAAPRRLLPAPSTLQDSAETYAPVEPTVARSSAGMSAAPTRISGGSPQNELTSVVTRDEVLDEPGTRELEGTRAPNVIIQKTLPPEIRVGRPADMTIQVRNVGNDPALDVRVFDVVPRGTSLVETVPPAKAIGDMLVWQLGDLRPGEERAVVIKLVPEGEGEIGSVARVTFEAAASARTIATRPQLELVQRIPEQVLIGQQLEIEIELSNQGTGSANAVTLLADLPEGLEHAQGRQLELPIGTMAPGAQQRQIMRLRATRPGVIQNTIVLVDGDGEQTRSTVEIEVVAPDVHVALDGPSLRYLERQATYNLQIANHGTADATNIEIAAFLDKGLKFVSTEAAGQYDAERHAVFWSLEELPAGRNGTVPLTLLPVEPGRQAVRLEANGDLGVTSSNNKELTIETLAELSFTIADDQDPIEVGSETIYEIRVQNTGTRDDSNVQLEVRLPHPALQLVTASPNARTDGKGRVVFDPIATIAAKGEHVFHVRVRGNTADTHLIKVMLNSDQSKRPVTKEESTTVYADN